ncbi:hypothetical protein QTI33_00030 [Variovorax sp. J22P271]|uniref:hypothetical protein n=1 Tax=Variovorax davisae TaxID=3053515 RepID=UPI0025784B07|nr:hypothetical protein [Variovorax sp. J22P271]MDM0030526.1 hypothetical protein [Variovorax sp. J22P271]
MKLLEFLVIASTFLAAAAQAGPSVTITFKNLNTTETANYTVENVNQSSTERDASPKPAKTVRPLFNDSYTVTSRLSPDATTATVQYVMGRKRCAFGTVYVNTTSTGGTLVRNATVTPSNGAICTARITSINAMTNAWTAEFTMK